MCVCSTIAILPLVAPYNYYMSGCNNKLAVFIVFHAESENPLTEANSDINDDQVRVFCSSEMDCLVLIYDCFNSDILCTLYIDSNDTKVMSIAANRLYSIAFFVINTSQDRPYTLERHPGKVMNDVVAGSMESSAASTSIDSVFLFCAVCLYKLLV